MIAETEAALRQGSPTAQDIADRLAAAREDFQAVVARLLNAPPNDSYAAAVPYLMLAGNLVAGWQMARAFLVAEAASSEFMTAKIATARFYTHHILPETGLQRIRAAAGL